LVLRRCGISSSDIHAEVKTIVRRKASLMALIAVDAINPLVGLLGRFGVLTAGAEIKISQANAAICVSSDPTDQVLATDLAGS
jgi:hypothetical protein